MSLTRCFATFHPTHHPYYRYEILYIRTCPAKSHAIKVTLCEAILPPSLINSPISIPTVEFPKTKSTRNVQRPHLND